MDTDEKKTHGGISRTLFAAVNVVLTLALAVSLIAFVSFYNHLRASIQSERADSVRQISTLISDRVTRLREAYAAELSQTAQTAENTRPESLGALAASLYDAERILLVNEKGEYCGLDGKKSVIRDTDLIAGLYAGDAVSTSFATIQTKGDYWLFARRLDGVVIGGVHYIGVVLAVDAQEYADVATIPLYDRQGESLVVAPDGTIKMRPSQAGEADAFGGYNLLRYLEKSDLSAAAQAGFAQALESADGGFRHLRDGRRHLACPEHAGGKRPQHRGAGARFADGAGHVQRHGQHPDPRGADRGAAGGAVPVQFRRDPAQESAHRGRARPRQIQERFSRQNVSRHPHAAQRHRGHARAGAAVHRRPRPCYDCLNKAKKSGEYLVSVINDVLDMSRIESGRMTRRAQAVQI
jgi:hypothetical protein